MVKNAFYSRRITLGPSGFNLSADISTIGYKPSVSISRLVLVTTTYLEIAFSPLAKSLKTVFHTKEFSRFIKPQEGTENQYETVLKLLKLFWRMRPISILLSLNPRIQLEEVTWNFLEVLVTTNNCTVLKQHLLAWQRVANSIWRFANQYFRLGCKIKNLAEKWLFAAFLTGGNTWDTSLIKIFTRYGMLSYQEDFLSLVKGKAMWTLEPFENEVSWSSWLTNWLEISHERPRRPTASFCIKNFYKKWL